MCGCNKGITNTKVSADKVRNVVKRIWEKSQIQEKPVIVKKINKQ